MKGTSFLLRAALILTEITLMAGSHYTILSRRVVVPFTIQNCLCCNLESFSCCGEYFWQYSVAEVVGHDTSSCLRMWLVSVYASSLTKPGIQASVLK